MDFSSVYDQAAREAATEQEGTGNVADGAPPPPRRQYLPSSEAGGAIGTPTALAAGSGTPFVSTSTVQSYSEAARGGATRQIFSTTASPAASQPANSAPTPLQEAAEEQRARRTQEQQQLLAAQARLVAAADRCRSTLS